MISVPVQWLSAIVFVGITESVTALSYLPAFRNDWRTWRYSTGELVDWYNAEAPFMFPPFFLAGALWFSLQLVNAIGAWFVWRADVDVWWYYVFLALWIASLLTYSLWAIPWEMMLPMWTLVDWLLAALLALGAAVAAWFVNDKSSNSQTIAGAILLTIYATSLLTIVGFNFLVALSRTVEGFPSHMLHNQWANPFYVYKLNSGWTIRTVVVDGMVQEV